jgi:hypothetical protein
LLAKSLAKPQPWRRLDIHTSPRFILTKSLSSSFATCHFMFSYMPRCPWATTEPNITYHDQEWGVPVHADRKLFEFLILEGAQAGLSWTTILQHSFGRRSGALS